jgi:hypothetical protein
VLKSRSARTWFLVGWFLASTALITYAAIIVEANRFPVRLATAPGWLPVLRAFFLVVTLIGFAYTWLLPVILPRRPLKSLQRTSRFVGMELGPEFQPLLVGLIFSSAPASYGLVLFLLGGRVQELYTFAGAAFVQTALWGLLNLVRPVGA